MALIAGAWLLLGFGVGLAALLALPTLFGYQTLTVRSGSMEPSLGIGSVVLDEAVSPLEVSRGDVVTFPDPGRRDQLVTHRLERMRVRGGTAYMVTRGDRNDTVERWSVPADGRVGRVAYHVPKVGYLRALVSTRFARLAALGLAVLLGFYLLVDIWRPPVGSPRRARRHGPLGA